MSLIAASLSALLVGCERSLIYYPSNPPAEQLERSAAAQGLEPWRDKDGNRIGWRAPAPAPSAGQRVAFVVFHGNAGHAAHRGYYAQGLQQGGAEPLPEVFLFEYPGYGDRPGKPSEESLVSAARLAVEELLAAGYDALYLVGESLGSGVASQLAGAMPEQVDGVLLVTPFTSLKDVALSHYPRIVVGMLLSERYDNVEALSRYDGPLGVVLAERDEVVPAALGRKLYDGYRGAKRLWVQEGKGHNTLELGPEEGWWREALDFLKSGAR